MISIIDILPDSYSKQHCQQFLPIRLNVHTLSHKIIPGLDTSFWGHLPFGRVTLKMHSPRFLLAQKSPLPPPITPTIFWSLFSHILSNNGQSFEVLCFFSSTALETNLIPHRYHYFLTAINSHHYLNLPSGHALVNILGKQFTGNLVSFKFKSALPEKLAWYSFTEMSNRCFFMPMF